MTEAPIIMSEHHQQQQEEEGGAAGGGGAPLVVGLSQPQTQPDAAYVLYKARQDGYDFVTTQLPHSAEPRSDVRDLEGKWWRTSVVGLVSGSNSNSGGDGGGCSLDEVSLETQMQWAWHMNLPAILFPAIPTQNEEDFLTYARCVYHQALRAPSPTVQFWIPISLQPDSLRQWQRLLQLCNYHASIGAILVFEVLPSNIAKEMADAFAARQLCLLHNALGHAVRAVEFPTGTFLTNKNGYPVLARAHQILVSTLLQRSSDGNIRFLIRGPARPEHAQQNTSNAKGQTMTLPYLQYLQHLRKRPQVTAALDSAQARLEANYMDELQRPLQPLKDHLDFGTYETFEKDPVKYERYQCAIYAALLDRAIAVAPAAAATSSPIATVLVVVGAGRGPLVTCALKAQETLQQQQQEQRQQFPPIPPLQVYAVEKNPSAVLSLQSAARHEPLWKKNGSGGGGGGGGGVQVIQADLRDLHAEMLGGRSAHVVVSELLGSFGDNELSPECLDALYRTTVCTTETVCIPTRYTAHVAPVCSVKLHQQAVAQALYPADSNSGSVGAGSGVWGKQVATETPYVVRTAAASQMGTEQDCWSFSHPTVDLDKTRFVAVDFAPAPGAGVTAASGYGKVQAQSQAVLERARWTDDDNDDNDQDGMTAGTGPTAMDEESENTNPALSQSGGSSAQSGAGTAAAVSAASTASTAKTHKEVPWIMTGLLGTFTADLYFPQNNILPQGSIHNNSNNDPNNAQGGNAGAGVIQISTAPNTFSEGMFSWFPLFFPLAEPVHVPAGGSVLVHLWRRVDLSSATRKAVWYEWSVTVHRNREILSVTPIHNPGGRSHCVSM